MTVPTNDMLPIPGYSKYAASRDGHVYSKRTQRPKAEVLCGRYLTVLVTGDDGKKRRRKVHQLIASAFFGPRAFGQGTRHLNCNSLDNRPENLAWGHSEGKRSRWHSRWRLQADRSPCEEAFARSGL